ncbi:GroES-like protein [Byssothecium circinans]|uniref:GroES-like protein n=1 Tax=Byssothecium circinans TaxID=147558 RepID=A0A6A5U8L5_9PLEO|nr:GroES-like protein [Byssothecium circinans]
MSDTMKAWIHTQKGPPSKVLSLSTLPIPKITSSDQVLVRISHCALNPGASIIMHLLPFIFRSATAIPEMDFAGTVTELGSSIPSDRNLSIGDKVFGSIPVAQHIKAGAGALAEYVVVEHTAMVKTPSGIKSEEVAGLGVAGATALELIKKAGLKKGNAVLVNGAGGGIGHLVVQMCRGIVGESGRVVAVCSSRHVECVEGLGVDQVVDYQAHPMVSSYLAASFSDTRFNAVVDAAGIQSLFAQCPTFLAEGGLYVTVGPKIPDYTYYGILVTLGQMARNILWPSFLGGTGRPYVQVTGVASLEGMEELARLVRDGGLKPKVGKCVGMESALEGYDELLGRHAQGKIVVTMECRLT